jgi:predicted enzyme related to lactoylglutathione lyase
MGKNAICHVEWASTDLERSKAFLWGLFGWEFQPFGEDYMVFSAPDGPGGGIWQVPEVRPGASPVVYVSVDSVDRYLEESAELGGGVVKGRTEIPELGWYAHITDPDGNLIGLFEPKG